MDCYALVGALWFYMSMFLRIVASGFLAVMAARVLASDDVPVLKVCEVLNNRTVYNGKSIIVVGEYHSWNEGAVLDDVCHSKLVTDGHEWPTSIWLADDAEQVAAPPSNLPDYRQHAAKILANLPELKRTKLQVVVNCHYSGVWAAVYGHFETKDSFSVVWAPDRQIGFGHLAMYPAQLVWPRKTFWCLVPSDKYPALEAMEKARQEEAKLALWRNIKDVLQRPDGLEYFETNMENRLLPALKGTVISTDLHMRPNVIVVAISDASTPEVTLKLDPSLNRSLVPGTEVEFEGVAIACTTQPFMITLSVAASKLTARTRRVAIPSQ